MLQLRVFGSSTDVGEIAARMGEIPGSRRVIRSGEGSVRQALVTADLVDDAADTALEQVRQMGVLSEDVILVRRDAIGKSVDRDPVSSVVWADLLSQANLNRRPVTRYLTFIVTAGVIAAFGVIYENSTLVVGAMAISPDTLPITAAATVLVLADDLRYRRVGRLWQLDVPRPALDQRDRGRARLLAANTRSATSAMSLASTAYTRRAPARAAAIASAPLPVPMSSTTSRVALLPRARQVVTRPGLVVGHARSAPSDRPAAAGTSIRISGHQRALDDQHVDDAHRRQAIGRAAFTSSRAGDRLPERHRPSEHGQRREAARPHIDDRTVKGVDVHVSWNTNGCGRPARAESACGESGGSLMAMAATRGRRN